MSQKRVINTVAGEDVEQVVQLTKNFWLHEFHCKDGVPVKPEWVEGLKAYAANLQAVRTFFDARTEIVSGYRTEARNRAVDGAPRSYHLYDLRGADGKFAADFAVQGVEPKVVYHVVLGLIRLGVMQPGGIGLYPWGVHYDNRGILVEF